MHYAALIHAAAFLSVCNPCFPLTVLLHDSPTVGILTTSIGSFSFILPLSECQPNLGRKQTMLEPFLQLQESHCVLLCVCASVCPRQDPIHRRSWDNCAPWTVSPPHQPRGTFPATNHSAELVSNRSQTMSISQITVLNLYGARCW